RIVLPHRVKMTMRKVVVNNLKAVGTTVTMNPTESAEETNIELFGTNWTCWVGRKTAQTTTTVKHGGEDIIRFSVKDTGQLGCRMELHGLNLDESFLPSQDSDRRHQGNKAVTEEEAHKGHGFVQTAEAWSC
uniref:Uncharacterized protein n=1 Tax=Astatotilapia calliptera TaxID=8154 RepID=A0A3P8PJA8_ASTCA